MVKYSPSPLKKSSRETAKERGTRLRLARSQIFKTRNEFAQASGISLQTLAGWESGYQPLSLKGAHRCIEALKRGGIHCTLEWLMYETGISPFLAEAANQLGTKQVKAVSQNTPILNEIIAFKENNPDSVVTLISDDGLSPYYFYGDYVGGIWHPKAEISSLIGKLCIIDLGQNQIIVRKLYKSKEETLYNLYTINPHTNTNPPVHFSQKIIRAAAILWHRTPN